MKNRGFDFGDFEITKREILASISIIAMMLLIGFVISGRISNYILDRNEKYNKAIKIESSDLFEYGMRTNVGYAFVYGDLASLVLSTLWTSPASMSHCIAISKCQYTNLAQNPSRQGTPGTKYAPRV